MFDSYRGLFVFYKDGPGGRLGNTSKESGSTTTVMMVTRHPSPANQLAPHENRNRLLAALPADEYARIAQSLETVQPKLKSVVHQVGDPIEHVYFPGGGFFSMLTVLKDGGMVEVATIGREGMVGITAILDGNPLSSTSMVQG